jgi:pimeloyl-ACP methyl ester carboxylesterase
MRDERGWSLERDGIVLAGEEHPGRDPAIVLLHGWCCDRSFLAPQIEYFASRDHHVVALDLRGHGQSGRGPESAESSVELLADDVAWLIEQLGLGRVMVAGHSMGGVVALELANRRAELVERIAMLDSIVAIPSHLEAAAQGLSRLLDSPRCSETIAEFVEKWLVVPGTDATLVRRVVDAMSGAHPGVALACWESLVAYDDRGALKACPVPLLFVASENSVACLAELPDMNPGLELACIAGVSHFHPLEAPDATNQLLERFFR